MCYAFFMTTKRLLFLYILPAMILACAVGDFVGMHFPAQPAQPVSSDEASPVPPGWYAHKQSVSNTDPSVLSYTILTKEKDLPVRNAGDGSLTDDDVYINVTVITSTPEAYVIQEDLSGPDAAMLGIQGTWGQFFSYKTFSVGTLLEGPGNLVLLFNDKKVESFNYNNSADAIDFWKVITYYAQHPSYY